MNTLSLKTFAIAASALLFFSFVVSSQDDPQMRSITSDDFKNKRPEKAVAKTASANSNSTSSKKYSYVRTEIKTVRQKQTNPPKQDSQSNTKQVAVADPSKKTAESPKAVKLDASVEPVKLPTEIGLTLWKLRPPVKNESGYFFSVDVDGKKMENWLAERVGVTSPFKIGDRVRLAIESSVDGFLYVINRETYSDGSVGTPYLIFPASPSDDNVVGPGMLFDIPDHREDFSYLTMELRPDTRAGYTGEHLTIIIAPKALSGFETLANAKFRSTAALDLIEDSAEAEVYDRTDTDDKIFTQDEADSSCGPKMRGLVREKPSEKPCFRTRQLTREDIQPQTIFRANTPKGKPTTVFVKLPVKQ